MLEFCEGLALYAKSPSVHARGFLLIKAYPVFLYSHSNN
jgi:hypothetical protein